MEKFLKMDFEDFNTVEYLLGENQPCNDVMSSLYWFIILLRLSFLFCSPRRMCCCKALMANTYMSNT